MGEFQYVVPWKRVAGHDVVRERSKCSLRESHCTSCQIYNYDYIKAFSRYAMKVSRRIISLFPFNSMDL